MKIYVKSNSFDGYLYIFKHGLGPGTIPKDVAIVKEKDLPNGYTAVWLDRFLRTNELKAYDIPSETEINRYLDRVGYCQKGGDVVPCDEIDTWEGYPLNACDKVTASEYTSYWKDFDEIVSVIVEFLDSHDKVSQKGLYDYLAEAGFSNIDPELVGKAWDSALSLYESRVNACGDIKASSIMASGNNNYTVGHCFSAEFSPMGFSNPEAAIKAWYRKQDDYIGDVYIDCKNSTYQDKLLNWVLANEDKVRQLDAKYPCMLKVDYLIDCCRKALEGNSKCYPFTDYKSVEACDKVTASSKSITSLMSPYADALTDLGYDGKKFLNEVSSEYTYDELSDADDLHACICGFILNSDYINQEDASKLADNVINQVGNINACDAKYFANMVSASNGPELDDDFLIEGYYDNQRRGLAESAETSDVSALNELANEYANKGYYIVVHNLTDGTIAEFSADNWFNDIAPDGGASLFMSW